MKIFIMLLSIWTVVGCSVSEKSTDTLSLPQSTGIETSRNGTAFTRGGVLETIERSDISGSDWREQRSSLEYNFIWDWLIDGPATGRLGVQRNFNYTSSNGKQYWFNYTFFDHRKDVQYSIVTDGKIIQQGWTTVKLSEQYLEYTESRGSEYGLIEFDVRFDGATKMLPVLMVQHNRGHRGVTWYNTNYYGFGLNNQKNKMFFENGTFFVNSGHILGMPIEQATPVSDISGSDWREQRRSLKYNNIWNWLIATNGKRQFNYNSDDGKQYWFNFTFFDHRKDVWYSIVENGQVIQTGYTTVKLSEDYLKYTESRGSEYGLIEFDVKFDGATKMLPVLMVQYRGGHRGVTWYNTNYYGFGLNSQINKIFFDRGNFFVNEGHIN